YHMTKGKKAQRYAVFDEINTVSRYLKAVDITIAERLLPSKGAYAPPQFLTILIRYWGCR
ncbi:MAG: hypothetical protein RR235_09990, partial [Oscillospiraceae bacterium]